MRSQKPSLTPAIPPSESLRSAGANQLDGRNLLAIVREGKIPALKLNERVFRFHARGVLIALHNPTRTDVQKSL